MAEPFRFWAIGAFVWGFAEATLFFIVPDVLLSYVGLKRGAKAAARASIYAAFGASIGGAAMFAWSAANAEAARAAVLAVPAINETIAGVAECDIATHGWFWATFLGALSTTPCKLYAVLAPHAGAPFLVFALASVAARLPRFVVVGVGTSIIARGLAPIVGERRLIWLLAGAWALFCAVFFSWQGMQL